MFIFGWFASIFAVSGAIMSAHKIKWCWVVWLVANVCSIVFCATAVTPIAWPIIMQETIFFIINVYGMSKWFKK